MNAAHIHLLLNHIPLIGTAFAILLFVAGIVRKSAELKKASMWIFVIAALITIPVFLSGEPAEEIVEHLPGVSEPIIEQHERAALFTLIVIEVLGAVSLAGLFFSRRSTDFPKLLAGAVLGIAVVAGGAMAWTANLGGQIRHSEIRSGAMATTNAPGEMGEHEKRQEAEPGKEKKEDDR
jgi:uncharacterized membrane protein